MAMSGNQENTSSPLADTKWRKGPKRSLRQGSDQWYLDKAGHQEANQFFADAKGGVPNNPMNAKSFMGEDQMVFNKNPYGDGQQYSVPEMPQFTEPNQWGSFGSAEPMAEGAEIQAHIGWGMSPADGPIQSPAKAKGTKLGLGFMGAGPQRDVPFA